MSLSLKYSIQESVMKPAGVTEDYIRLQVAMRPELEQITISDKEYQTILNGVREGRLVGLRTESGAYIGQFQPSLAGGFPKAGFIAPSKTDFRVTLRSTQQFLNDAREGLTFERVSTVINSPNITAVTFTISDGSSKTVLINTIAIETSGILSIEGAYFTKNDMIIEVSQGNNTMRFTETLNSGTKFINVLLNDSSIPAKGGFTAGLAQLKVWRNNKAGRNSIFPIQLQ